MDRLTYWDEYGNADIIGVDGADLQSGIDFDEFNKVTEALNRLAAYEDTGLTPEVCRNYKIFEDEAISKNVPFSRIVELMNAEAEGRLIVLPCKVGDNVFALTDVCLCPIDERCCGDCTGAGCRYASCEVRECKTNSIIQIIRLAEKIGKNVFLSREEAERALKEMK